MFDIINTSLSAAVADNGTFTVGYPAGKSAATYTGAHKHKMGALQSIYEAPVDFTLTFGASSITVTWLANTTLPAGTEVNLQVDRLGTDDGQPEKAAVNRRIVKAPLTLLDLGSPGTADADGVSASQTVTGAGTAFLINGALADNGAVVFDTPRNVVAAWTNTAVLTITGTDVDDNAVVEKSASGTSHTGKKAFKTVTGVTTSATVTSATVGSGVVIGLPVRVFNASHVIVEQMDGIALPKYPSKVIIPYEIEQTQLLAATAEQIDCPVAGWIAKVRGVVQAAVTTGGAVTVEVNTTAVTGLTFTIANADAAGVNYSDVPTTRHGSTTVVAAGDSITVTPGAAIDTAGELNGSIEIDVSPAGQLDGTFVAAVDSAATATTGDSRGTYSPAITPDGTHAYSLIVMLPDPGDIGVAQYTG